MRWALDEAILMSNVILFANFASVTTAITWHTSGKTPEPIAYKPLYAQDCAMTDGAFGDEVHWWIKKLNQYSWKAFPGPWTSCTMRICVYDNVELMICKWINVYYVYSRYYNEVPHSCDKVNALVFDMIFNRSVHLSCEFFNCEGYICLRICCHWSFPNLCR